MVRTIGFAGSVRPLLAVAALSLFGTSVAFGWGRAVSVPKRFDRFLNETEAGDLLGRWHLDSVADDDDVDRQKSRSVVALDIVTCGKRYCGIAVRSDGTCGAIVLTFDDRGPAFAETDGTSTSDRFVGSFRWRDETARYIVYLDVHQGLNHLVRPAKDRHTNLSVFGSSDGILGRDFPLAVEASYSGVAVCKPPTS